MTGVALEARLVAYTDPLVVPMLTELDHEYWTHSAHRRRGLARRVLAELEREIRARGYERIHLTTGPRQPEAKALYLATGYTPLYDPDLDPEVIGSHPFEKLLRRDPDAASR